MTVFDHPPTDAELRTLVDSAGMSSYLKLTDDGTIFTARRVWPEALYWASVGPIVALWCVALVWKWDELLGSDDSIWKSSATVMSIGMVILPAVGLLWLRRQNRLFRTDEFFTLDRTAPTLTLSRNGVALRHDEVVAVTEVHAWHFTHDAEEGVSADYLREVSVLATDASGQFARHSVVIAAHAKPVGLVAAALAAAFGVQHRKFVESFFFVGRWRTESPP